MSMPGSSSDGAPPAATGAPPAAAARSGSNRPSKRFRKDWWFHGTPLPGGKVPSLVAPVKDAVAKEHDVVVDWMRDGLHQLEGEGQMQAMLPSDKVDTVGIMDQLKEDRESRPWTLETLPIFVYTLTMDSGDSVYNWLNDDMRVAAQCKAPQRRVIKQAWGLFVRTLVTSLRLLPAYVGYCYRGIVEPKEHVEKHYRPSSMVRWTSFTSASWSMSAAWIFIKRHAKVQAGEQITMFRIKSTTAKRIDQFSEYEYEGEVLFEPNTYFTVVDADATADPPLLHPFSSIAIK